MNASLLNAIQRLYFREDVPPLKVIAEYVGVSHNYIAQIVRRNGWKRSRESVFTDRKKERANVLRKNGATLEAISDELNISINTIHKFFTYGDPIKPKPKQRKCLCCDRPFMSIGPGNRMCHTCKDNGPRW